MADRAPEAVPDVSSTTPAKRPAVTGWLLAGGEGRRMGGLDKGLQTWRGHPLAWWVLHTLMPQVDRLGISANRNVGTYEQLLQDTPIAHPPNHGDAIRAGVHPDDPDLPASSGPLAGILTGLRRCQTDWLQLAACDTPRLPADLVDYLLAAASDAGADVAVPCTQETGPDGLPEDRPHWTCALVHKRVTPDLGAAFVKGDRKVGRWIQSQRWVAVSFAPASDFENMNTLETLDDRA